MRRSSGWSLWKQIEKYVSRMMLLIILVGSGLLFAGNRPELRLHNITIEGAFQQFTQLTIPIEDMGAHPVVINLQIDDVSYPIRVGDTRPAKAGFAHWYYDGESAELVILVAGIDVNSTVVIMLLVDPTAIDSQSITAQVIESGTTLLLGSDQVKIILAE